MTTCALIGGELPRSKQTPHFWQLRHLGSELTFSLSLTYSGHNLNNVGLKAALLLRISQCTHNYSTYLFVRLHVHISWMRSPYQVTCLLTVFRFQTVHALAFHKRSRRVDSCFFTPPHSKPVVVPPRQLARLAALAALLAWQTALVCKLTLELLAIVYYQLALYVSLFPHKAAESGRHLQSARKAPSFVGGEVKGGVWSGWRGSVEWVERWEVVCGVVQLWIFSCTTSRETGGREREAERERERERERRGVISSFTRNSGSPLSGDNINQLALRNLTWTFILYGFCFVAAGPVSVLTPTPTNLPKMVGRQMVLSIDNSGVFGSEAIVQHICGLHSLPLNPPVNTATSIYFSTWLRA